MVMHVELQATCSALGYQEGKTYVKEPDCLETVKDLIRFLRREDDSCDIRRQLGHAQILQNDLIPIIKQHSKDRQLFETIIRLVVNLTQPAVLCFKNQIPSDKTLRNYYLEIESHLQNYKEAFLDEELFSVLTERLGELLKLDWENRHEEDRLLIERLLILIRNVLHVPPNLDKEQRTDDDASVHDQVVWAMHCSGLEDLLLYVASSDEERQFSLHILEIISLMFREQTPEMLVSAGVQKSVAEKEKDERELEMVREQEKAQKLANIMKINARHSRFGGTYVVKNMKSISDKELIYHKTQQNAGNLTFDQTKKPKKKARNRQPIKDQPLFRRSTLSIRLSLKEFCIQFLENCYNPLMYAVKDSLNRQKAQDHDETYYLWSIRFFMEFCRLHSQQVELVSETMSVQAFHYIQVQLITYYEMQAMEKKEAVIWGKRIHLALKAYQELLMTLDMMGKSKNPQLYESAKVISGNIFYVMEFRDIFVSLLRKFDESRLSRSYLKDLVESTHLFLKMLEGACKKSSHLIVQTKKKKSTKKKKKQREVTKEHEEPSQQQLDDDWDEISGQLSAMMQGREEIPTDVAPFDAASEVEEEQQKADAMIRIQDCLRGKDPGTAIALFRAAREVWPERDIFGTQDISPEDEFMALREVFMASLPRPVAENTQYDEEEDGPDIGEEIEEEEMAPVESSEKEFDFKEYLHKFCKGEIIKCYVLLLADFNKNSTYTNHCIVKMLHRISVEMSYVGMMFQASLLRTFQKILLSPVSKLDRYKEILTFGKYIIRNFVQVAEQNPKVFVEILFWKTNKDASEIIHGYGSYQSKAKVLWTEDQEMELRRLYDEYSTVEDPERDVVDCIMQHITDRSKTRGQIIRELKNQGLIESAKDLKKPKRGARPGAWTEEETFDLANLMDMYRDSSDPIGNILANMQQKRSKAKVIEKLIELGLVNDRKELYKKRQRKSRKKNSWGDNEGDEDDDDDDDEHQQKEFQELPSDFEDPASSPNSSDKEMSDDSDSSDDDDGPDESSVASETSASMMDVIKNIIDKGYKDQVIWIQKSVERVTEEKKKQSNDVPVPIVPFTEENETAMEDEMFLNFLRKIGISPPANEQEAFWRIPGDMTVQELSTLSEGLTLDEDGVPINADKIKVHSASKQKEKKKDKKKENHKKQKEKDKQKKKKQKESSKKDKGGKNDPISKAKALKDLLKKRKLNKKRQSLEEKENMEERAPSLDDDEDNEKIPSPKRNRVQRMLSSDSDSDDDIPIMSRLKNKPSQSSDKTDPVHQSEERQEEEKEDSDREVMNSESQSSQSKRPLVFPDSSDEDDEENVQNPSKRLKLGASDEEDAKEEEKEDEHNSTASSTGKKFALRLESSDSEDDDEHIPLRKAVQKRQIISDDEDD